MPETDAHNETTVVLVHGAFADAGSWAPVTRLLVENRCPGDGRGQSSPQDSVLTTAVLPKEFPIGDGTETATELIIDPARFREVFTADLSEVDPAVYGLSQRPIAASALTDETGHPAWKDLPVWSAVGTADKAAGADVVRFMAQRAHAQITEIEGSHVIMISQPQQVTDVIMAALEAVGQPVCQRQVSGPDRRLPANDHRPRAVRAPTRPTRTERPRPVAAARGHR